MEEQQIIVLEKKLGVSEKSNLSWDCVRQVMVFSNSIIAISIMSSNTIRQSSSVFSGETKVGLPTGNVNSVECWFRMIIFSVPPEVSPLPTILSLLASLLLMSSTTQLRGKLGCNVGMTFSIKTSHSSLPDPRSCVLRWSV